MRAHVEGSTLDISILIIVVIIIMYLISLCRPRAHIRDVLRPSQLARGMAGDRAPASLVQTSSLAEAALSASHIKEGRKS